MLSSFLEKVRFFSGNLLGSFIEMISAPLPTSLESTSRVVRESRGPHPKCKNRKLTSVSTLLVCFQYDEIILTLPTIVASRPSKTSVANFGVSRFIGSLKWQTILKAAAAHVCRGGGERVLIK